MAPTVATRPKNPLFLGLLGAVILGLIILGILSIQRGLGTGGATLKAIPFGPEPGTRIRHGIEFNLKAAVQSTSPSTRIRWEDVAKRLSETPGLERSGRLEEALQVLASEASDFEPLQYALTLNVADSLLQGLRKPGSQDELRLEALSAMAHPFARYVHGRLALVLGKVETAQASFNKAVDAAPDFAFAWSQLGYIAMEKGETKLAKSCFQKAIGLMESDSSQYQKPRDHSGLILRFLPMVEMPPYGGLAQLYLSQNHPDTAAQIMGYAEDRGWRDGQLALARAWWWEFKGQMAKARGIYDSLEQTYPSWDAIPRLRDKLGLKGSSERDGQQALFAIRTLDPLIKAYPANAPLRLALAQAYIQRGLYGLAVSQLDSGLALDPNLTGAEELRREAYGVWVKQEGRTVMAKTQLPDENAPAASSEDPDPVVIPSSLALLGTYSVSWGASAYRMREAYPRKRFLPSQKGNLVDRFVNDGLLYENVSAYKNDSLWGILATVSDTTQNHIDVFGRMIRMKTKISGEGRGTGEATCPGYRSFQGAIWENDDTFEFMAQFQGKENQVRLARIARSAMPLDRRLCDMVRYLDRDFWEDPQGMNSATRKPEKALRQSSNARSATNENSSLPKNAKSTVTVSGKSDPAKKGTGIPIITPASPEFDANDLENQNPDEMGPMNEANQGRP
jgi:tetratricopeptide (TPR) repeat protein